MGLHMEFIHVLCSVTILMLFRNIVVNVTSIRLSFESVLNLVC